MGTDRSVRAAPAGAVLSRALVAALGQRSQSPYFRGFVFILLAGIAFAQDERCVSSPKKQLEMCVFVTTQETSTLSRIAYRVAYGGKPLLETSYMGFDILDQEPLLGENVGLTSSSSTKGDKYNSLVMKYMQNGSLGRLINVETRAYDDGVAFRYVIPRSTPLMEIPIAEEATEFRFAANPPVAREAVTIGEAKVEGFPRMRLMRESASTELTRLERKFEGTTPLTCPWRIVSIGAGIAAELK